MKIKSLFILLFLSVFTFAHAQLTDYSIFDKKFNFYVANDLGRNGYYDQKPIAELMGTMGEEIGPEFVLATGRRSSLRRCAQRERPLVDDQLRAYLLPPRTDDRLVLHFRQPRIPRKHSGSIGLHEHQPPLVDA